MHVLPFFQCWELGAACTGIQLSRSWECLALSSSFRDSVRVLAVTEPGSVVSGLFALQPSGPPSSSAGSYLQHLKTVPGICCAGMKLESSQ